MKYIHRFFKSFLDFLYPKSKSLLIVEALNPSDLVHILPSSKANNDKNKIILFDYSDPRVKEMIWELKYKGNRIFAKKFAVLLYDVLQIEVSERSLFENFSTPLLIPMPTSNERKRERGYNQTEILCEEIKKLDVNNLFEYDPKILIKEKHTESQSRSHATKRERVENLDHSLNVINKNKILNRSIILIDDVTTSGATFNEAKRALMGAHAKKILCVALAH
jgi:competence protein ComFC